ncbi:MAG TPA: hypothetical protein ENN75_04050 [candidate division Zixibacteria bacterium]|nr:hypothetical protein [candidate division Zixibacteria bacterium]
MFNADSIDIAFTYSLFFWGFALFVAAVFTYLAYRIVNPPLPKFRKGILIALRFIGFLAIVIMLLEPVIKWVNTREVQPRIAILWDSSKSMSLEDRSGDRRIVISELRDSDAIKEILRDYPADQFSFSDSLAPLENLLTLDGEQTATGQALMDLRSTYAEGDPLGAVILISDGQANYGADPVGVAYRMDVPIFTVGIGDPTPPKDITLRKLAAQKVAYVDREFPIIAGISAYGYGSTETTALLFANGIKLDEKRIALPDQGEIIDVTFDVVPDSEGVVTYRVSVPALDGELTADNNARSTRVEILPSKKKILVIGPHPNWEITFLLRALRTDPDLDVLTAFFGKSVLAGDVRIPTSLAEFQEFDAVYAVGCVKEMSANNIDIALLDYLNDGGGAAIHLLGDANLGATTTWDKIFPFIYSSGSHVWTRDQFVPELTVEGLVHPITRLSDDIPRPADAFAKLPPLSGFAMVTGNATGATALLSHPRLSEVSILAIREIGPGRMLFINGAGLWRWAFVPAGFGGDVSTYRALMLGSAAWLLAAGQGDAFIIETDLPVYRSGEEVIISARLRDEANQPLSGAEISTTIFNTESDSDAVSDTFNLVLEERTGGIYTTRLPSIGIGNWRISAVAELEEQELARAGANFLVEPYSLEMENVRLNENALRNISEITGGAYFRAGDIDSLVGKIRIKPLLRRDENERGFWDNPILLIIFVLALCGEWIIRKRSDLP